MTKEENRYEFTMVIIFLLTFGFIFMDRNALALLLPIMVDEMSLNNSQIGQVNMLQTIGFAIGGPVIAFISERIGKRKQFILWAILLTAMLSALTMFSSSYSYLLVVRALLGLVEGGIFPLMLAMVSMTSRRERFARNVGLVFLGPAIIGVTLGPIVVTQLAELTDWRMTFLLISVPTLILAGVTAKYIKSEPEKPKADHSEQEVSQWGKFGDMLKNRNIVLCILLSIFNMSAVWTILSFSPIYFTSIGQLSVEQMGFTMAGFGLLAILWTYFIPYSSDYIGRKSALLLYCFLGMLVPLVLYAYPGGWTSIIVFVLMGGMLPSIISMYTNIIPMESGSISILTISIATISAVGELVGSFAIGISGALADAHGLGITMIISMASCFVCLLLGVFLRETRTSISRIEAQQQPSIEI